MAADDYFFPSDLSDGVTKARPYKFDRPWGVPVRYHDAEKFLEICQPDIIEFHLSYKDMDRDPADYLSGTYDIGFVVHAPELFAGSRLMDLATDDEAYRRYSLEQTQRVIDITRGLKKFFPKTKRPPIVANIGGFSMDAPLPPEKKAERYRIFAESLAELDVEGVELIPQTMAPFPWHFGGQRYQNIFIFPEESAAFVPGMIYACASIFPTPSLPPIISASTSPRASRSSARTRRICISATPRSRWRRPADRRRRDRF